MSGAAPRLRMRGGKSPRATCEANIPLCHRASACPSYGRHRVLAMETISNAGRRTMRITPTLSACALALVLCAACSTAAGQTAPEPSSIEEQIESLRATQAAMRQELQELRALLQRSPTAPATAAAAQPAAIELSLDDAQIHGAPQARVALVEFSDFQCPFCARYATSSYPQIARDYVDTGRLQYAFMGFPLEGLHPAAFRQHVAAACAGDQGRFWEMHDRLFAGPKAIDARALAGIATAIGLNGRTFRACLESERHGGAIRRAMKVGEGAGGSGTPTFLIGVLDADKKFRAPKTISGAKPYSVLKDAI